MCVGKLTNKVLIKAYMELNQYKESEMLVQQVSKNNTTVHLQATCSMDDLQNITDEADLEDLQRLAAALTGAAGDDAALAAALTETAALATAIAGK